MFGRVLFIPAGLTAACALSLLTISPASAQTCPQPVGPDVIVGDLQGVANYTAEGGYDAFSFGTTSCNIGNQNVLWQAFSSNLHPAIAQNLFKWKTVSGSTRFEQIGQSWLKHGFTALTQNACCTCSGQGGSVLGVGCSDPYTAGRNGTQSGAGPKWQVDATAGYFPTGGPANPGFTGSVARRLRVKATDLEVNNASVRFFGECQYVTQDDANAGNKNNNVSYREDSMAGGPTEWNIANLGSTVRMKTGIEAWKAIDPTVVLTNVTTPETANPSSSYPGCCTSALVIVGVKVTSLGGGIYHYEYAVQNVNSHRSIASFSIPLTAGMTITNIGFHDVDYHSADGEGSVNRDGTDWTVNQTTSAISWSTVPFATNANSNALRWGTLYNFRFDCDRAPTTGNATLGTYRVVGSLSASTQVPTPITPCPPDITGDLQVNINDLLAVINAWGPCPPPCPADVNGDGQVNINDLLVVVNAWGPCP